MFSVVSVILLGEHITIIHLYRDSPPPQSPYASDIWWSKYWRLVFKLVYSRHPHPTPPEMTSGGYWRNMYSLRKAGGTYNTEMFSLLKWCYYLGCACSCWRDVTWWFESAEDGTHSIITSRHTTPAKSTSTPAPEVTCPEPEVTCPAPETGWTGPTSGARRMQTNSSLWNPGEISQLDYNEVLFKYFS